MKIHNTAFVIPTHPPDYQYVYNFVNKLQSYDISIDVYVVFTSYSEYTLFLQKQYVKAIILPENTNTNSMTTYKKFHGLQRLMHSNYEFIICCDSEIDIIPENFTSMNITEKLQNIFNHKKIYAGTILTEASQISANLFHGEDYERLTKETNNFHYFFWWSDCPVYKRSHLDAFFKKIQYDAIEWHHFDYIVYQYFLLLTEGFTIVNTTPITNMNWSLERLNTTNESIFHRLIQEHHYGFGWVSKPLYDKNVQFCKKANTFLLYHTDRQFGARL